MIHLGIDFGTANTRVSVLRGAGIPQPVEIAKGPSVSPFIMPSSCVVDRDGTIEVGERVLSRPDRLKFIKRFWQGRPEDRGVNPWGPDGTRVMAGRTYTCEQMVEAVVAEAIERAFAKVGIDPAEGFSANVVCPVTFDLNGRNALKNILCNRGARSVTLSNVIDEPLASAVLYGRVATRPPVNKDLLVFDAGAGTVDLAIVRYEHTEGRKGITVLAEQGRCRAGADLDWVLQALILEKIAQTTGIVDPKTVYGAYSSDLDAGKIIFEEECEQRKLELSNSTSISWRKERFLGREQLGFSITQEEFAIAARPVTDDIDGAVQAVLREAQSFVQSFDGVDIALLVGGSSRVPFIRRCVERNCPGAVIEKPEGYFDELLATVQGTGFDKDFEDLVIKRPPYTTELRVVLADGSARSVTVHQAFAKLYPFWQSFVVAVPYAEVKKEFDAPIEEVKVRFISPAGHVLEVSETEFPANCLRGERCICAQLDVQANLRIAAGGAWRTIRMPYFAQLGLRSQRPFALRDLNLPDWYPAEN